MFFRGIRLLPPRAGSGPSSRACLQVSPHLPEGGQYLVDLQIGVWMGAEVDAEEGALADLPQPGKGRDRKSQSYLLRKTPPREASSAISNAVTE